MLVNTPTDLKTNVAAADKHVGRGTFYRQRHPGQHHVNAPVGSGPLPVHIVNSVGIAGRRASHRLASRSGQCTGTSPHVGKQDQHLRCDFQTITGFRKLADFQNTSGNVFISAQIVNFKDPNYVFIQIM